MYTLLLVQAQIIVCNFTVVSILHEGNINDRGRVNERVVKTMTDNVKR